MRQATQQTSKYSLHQVRTLRGKLAGEGVERVGGTGGGTARSRPAVELATDRSPP